MLLRQLRYFHAVAEEGSVMRASTRLRVAQPALSRHLQALETTVGTSLLDREPRGVSPTPAGRILLGAIKPIFARIDGALDRVRLANEGKLGTLRVGLARAAVDSSILARAMKKLREEQPHVRIIAIEAGATHQAEMLRTGELDLAIGLAGAGDTDLVSYSIHALNMDCAVLPATHPLANAESIDVGQLGNERLLVIGPLVAAFHEVLESLRRLGVEGWEAHSSIESVYSLIAAGQGWTLAPRSLASKAPPGTVVRPLRELGIPMTLAARARRDDTSPLIANVVSSLHRMSNEAATTGAAEPTAMSSPRDSISVSLEIRHLRALVAATEHRSVGLGAARLGITQSGLSRQLRALEREVGVPLLRRKSHGVVPTAAGEVLRAEASQVLAMLDAAIAQTRRMVNGIAGRCTVGTMAAEYSDNLLVPALKYMVEHHPGVSVEVMELRSVKQLIALRERRIDIGIAGVNADIDDPLISGVRIVEDTFECAMVADSHPLASRAWLTPSDLANVPFIFIERATNPKFYDTVMERFADIGLVPRMGDAFDGPRALWRAAADLNGWTLGNRSMRSSPVAGLVAVPIEGLHIPSGLQLIWRRDESDAAVLAMIEAFRRPPSLDAQAVA